MSNLMKLLGTVLALLGLVLGALSFIQPGRMQAYGIQLDAAVFLLVGGILAVGLGGVIDAFRSGSTRKQAETVGASRLTPVNNDPAADNAKAGAYFRKPASELSPATEVLATAAAAVAGISADEAEAAVKGTVSETITALEQAKQDIMKSMGGMDETTGEDAKGVADLEPEGPEDDEVASTGDSESGADGLFVVEEKVIRGRPARILSDDTIEAETDEGWMRFEDFDHLNEYLDSMEEQSS